MVTRIQRRRTAGYRQPPRTLYVGRPTRFANPYPITITTPRAKALDLFRAAFWSDSLPIKPHDVAAALAGYDHISCFCPLDAPCHADELIKALSIYPTPRLV